MRNAPQVNIVRKFIGFLIVSAGVFLVSSDAEAYIYDIPDTTLVEKSDHSGWVDRLGPDIFEVFGIDYAQAGSALNFSIYTNFPEDGKLSRSWQVRPAHFGFDIGDDGSYEYALVLSAYDPEGLTKGNLYSVTTWWPASHYAPDSSYLHGLSDVTMNSGSLISLGNLAAWNASTKDGIYQIDFSVDLTDMGLGPYFDLGVRWSPTCANDLIEGNVSCVPEPVSIALLMSGLVGLAAIRRKRG